MDLAALDAWYARVRRPLPWRGSRDPYRIWLSEIMSQQTTIKAVIPYYHRFLAAFPTVEDLAAAPLERVLELWAGLGYYRRARYLHACARELRERGGFPRTVEGLRALPGIGAYTAAAIASIAFDQRAAVIDGNVERVLARVHLITAEVKRGAAAKTLRRFAEDHIKRAASPGEHNQALMELGALVCRPAAQARCQECPIAPGCRAHQAGRVEALPKKPPRARARARLDRALAIPRGAALLYGVRQAGAVWGGMLELPRLTIARKEAPAASARRIARQLLGLSGARLFGEAPIARARTSVMNERIELEVYAAAIDAEPRALEHQELRWLEAEAAAGSALPAPQRRVLAPVFEWCQGQAS